MPLTRKISPGESDLTAPVIVFVAVQVRFTVRASPGLGEKHNAPASITAKVVTGFAVMISPLPLGTPPTQLTKKTSSPRMFADVETGIWSWSQALFCLSRPVRQKRHFLEIDGRVANFLQRLFQNLPQFVQDTAFLRVCRVNRNL
jgi:hypothetical protein